MSLSREVLFLCEGYEYASTQFPAPPELEKIIKNLQKEIDPEDLNEEEGGFETEYHITLLFGLTGGVSTKAAAEELLSEESPVEVETTKIEIFSPEGRDYDVVVVRVKGAALRALRKKMETLPNEQTFPEYKPHATVAYVKKGTGKKYRSLEVPSVTVTLNAVDYSTKGGKHTRIKLRK